MKEGIKADFPPGERQTVTEQTLIHRTSKHLRQTHTVTLNSGPSTNPDMNLSAQSEVIVLKERKSPCVDEVRVDGWVKHGSFIQETRVRVPSETASQPRVIITRICLLT